MKCFGDEMEHPVKDYYYSSGGFGGQHNPNYSLLFSLYTSGVVLKECATTEQQQQKLEVDDNKIQSSFHARQPKMRTTTRTALKISTNV